MRRSSSKENSPKEVTPTGNQKDTVTAVGSSVLPDAASEASGGTLLITDRTSRTKASGSFPEPKRNRGSMMSSVCPRGGYIWLTSKNGQGIMPTNCKTWGCRSCRDRLLNLFRMRVEAGVSALGKCAFITFTYKTGYESMRDAASVAEDWKELWRRLRSNGETIGWFKWLRVVELTKKGQPHLHVVMESQEEKVRCYGRVFDARSFRRRAGSCHCMSHRLSDLWEAITGDSWLVHTMPVVSAYGAARYLSKYLLKTMGGVASHEPLERLGFKRRWSSSRGWPGSGRLRLAQSLRMGEGVMRLKDGRRSGWNDMEWIPISKSGSMEAYLDRGIEERVGPEAVKRISEKRAKKGKAVRLGRLVSNVSNDSPSGRGNISQFR